MLVGEAAKFIAVTPGGDNLCAFIKEARGDDLPHISLRTSPKDHRLPARKPT
jgi:hypothetical protein